jgi:hypothetical protein
MNQAMLTSSQVRQVYRHLLVYFSQTGHPPAPEIIARALHLSGDAVERALDHIEEQGSIYRDPATHTILAAYPFSAKPTDHIVRFADGHSVYAMCAIDALGMPVMLNADAAIESKCAHCGKEIRVVVRDNALMEYMPQETRVSYTQADACCVAALEQCPLINFFCSPEHLAAWRAHHPNARGGEFDIQRAFVRGREVFGNILRPEGSRNGESV